MGGSPYSTSLRDQGIAMPAPAAAYSAGFGWAGSDSSQQLYRNSSLGSKDKDKKRVCSVLLIATSTLVVMAVLAIAATAAYLGGEFHEHRLAPDLHSENASPTNSRNECELDTISSFCSLLPDDVGLSVPSMARDAAVTHLLAMHQPHVKSSADTRI